MSTPIRVFVGSGPEHLVEETVFVRSLLRHASRPVEVDVIDGGSRCVRRFGTGEVRPLPEAWAGRLSGATVFSFARFAPPELCGYRGKAIYCESDQLVLGDIAELWDHPLDGAAMAAVPHEALRSEASPFQSEGYLSSVVLFDSARCRNISVAAITHDVRRNRLAYQDAICLTDRCLETLGVRVAALSPGWNDLERRLDDTKILHFTDRRRQPWLHPFHPENDSWIRAYLECIDAHLLDHGRLDVVQRLGGISRRVQALPRLPRWLFRPVDVLWQYEEELLGRGASEIRGWSRAARKILGR